MKPQPKSPNTSFLYRGAVPILVSAWLSRSAQLRVLLARHVEGYPPNPRHESVAQVLGELDGRAMSKGYTRQDLVGRSANDGGDFLAKDVIWSDLRSVEAYRWAILFDVATNRPLIALDCGAQSLRGVTHHTLRFGEDTTGRVFTINHP
jgi:hypothetical protein